VPRSGGLGVADAVPATWWWWWVLGVQLELPRGMSGSAGKGRRVEFDFDVETDTTEALAEEMAEALNLDSNEQQEVRFHYNRQPASHLRWKGARCGNHQTPMRVCGHASAGAGEDRVPCVGGDGEPEEKLVWHQEVQEPCHAGTLNSTPRCHQTCVHRHARTQHTLTRARLLW
jgi:hypothetical protein